MTCRVIDLIHHQLSITTMDLSYFDHHSQLSKMLELLYQMHIIIAYNNGAREATNQITMSRTLTTTKMCVRLENTIILPLESLVSN